VGVRQSPARNAVVEDGLADDGVEKEEAGLCGSTKSEEPTTVESSAMDDSQQSRKLSTQEISYLRNNRAVVQRREDPTKFSV